MKAHIYWVASMCQVIAKNFYLDWHLILPTALWVNMIIFILD